MKIDIHIQADSIGELAGALRAAMAEFMPPVVTGSAAPVVLPPAYAGPVEQASTAPVVLPPAPQAETEEKPKRTRRPKPEEPAAAPEEKSATPEEQREAAQQEQAEAAGAVERPPAADEKLTIEKVREVLTEYQNRHPKKVAATVELIQSTGAKRLSEVDPAKWPELVGAARDWLAANPAQAAA
ncbi:hypothetical protein [Microcystis phage MJing1]|nr:hypothetical protein [Microcystis phage MJing1]